jgi:predicted transcriptional regulator
MTLRSDGRRVLSVTMQPALYDELIRASRAMDQPTTVVVRAAIKQWLESRQRAPDA